MGKAVAVDTIDPLSQPKDAAAEAPSGFILKLFQMVNGAPDQVIAWTDEGDAFVIGSDIGRLESETLPQYFRHNRFQSLVRQLNFYSFRKINRERNVWIYKHDLFHRDRPDDLYLVRRRTCMGLDGRKQRLPRSTTRRQVALEQQKGGEDSSGEGSNDESVSVKTLRSVPTKRTAASDTSSNKRARSIASKASGGKSASSALAAVVEDSRAALATGRAWNGVSNHDRAEIVEQSIIVSEVATKLEEYARKAKFGRRVGSNRRHGSGVVTPPEGSFSVSDAVLTYDDEDYGYESDYYNLGRSVSNGSLEDNSESITRICDDKTPPEYLARSEHAVVSPDRSPKFVAPPVLDETQVHGITQRILLGSPLHTRSSLVAPVAVAGFCMSTAPMGDEHLFDKIQRLIASCASLKCEFQGYRAALHPTEAQSGVDVSVILPSQSMLVTPTWGRIASREDAVRDFRVFSVNCIRQILATSNKGNLCSMTLISSADRSTLEHTANVWQESVSALA